MPKGDQARLRHILDAAKEAIFFADGKSRDDLDKNRMLVLSLVKEIEIIGEAAGKISEEIKRKYMEVPWLDMSDMRNHLIHVYFEIDLDILWDTVINDLPPLIDQLEKILSSDK